MGHNAYKVSESISMHLASGKCDGNAIGARGHDVLGAFHIKLATGWVAGCQPAASMLYILGAMAL